ncbi:uncharacterized protein LAESUDRAFT_377896 [Laetiporus sulphureus 93-53]|uniref:Uncharacterized protein n=1 Tax=Laetiporus sulphureus 93-53 TaxID=1314785 RepID=A0A165CPZ0_9APHY|nr:uncharacterized protein LAESUDRAFT_377896 [Laetiporus sulphureus 93-53]KZT03207.1 hypothetical protein LAESUDRAFT_377896 [Laetiporus sulphureus 93-53]
MTSRRMSKGELRCQRYNSSDVAFKFLGALVMEIGYCHTAKSPDNDEFIRLVVTDALEAGSLEATLSTSFLSVSGVPLVCGKTIELFNFYLPLVYFSENTPSWILGANFKRKAYF